MATAEMIIKLTEKNKQFENVIFTKLRNIVELLINLKGSFSLFNQRNLESLSAFLFLAASFKITNVSPGEEYFETHFKGQFTLIHILYLSCLKLVLARLELALKNILFNSTFFENRPYAKLLKDTARFAFTQLENCQFFETASDIIGLTFLFLTGRFSLLIKNEIALEKEIDNMFPSWAYVFFGTIVCSSYLYDTVIFVRKVLSHYRQLEIKAVGGRGQELKLTSKKKSREVGECVLCMDRLKEITLTKCGHLFCWSCITKYLQYQPSCPLCKSKCLAQNVVRLRCDI